ncbi:type IV secretory system conjugative DNA transfer family protein [Kribbella antibiotica]|uniref:Type IV secretory system conjugative DNA transfer family protein n=1 Tax=Kribbella antibiotica TaxID=190195 RepID=A0A4R4ZVH9_9ACTN|nr:type IV secretory system conjugative DNA transfer family protein [Kribbella antibiotica]TDD62039.1 type IV secretory system conjugative DNA transfer family protein [Kribbella antibiotica]
MVKQTIRGTQITTNDVYRPAVGHAAVLRISSRKRALRTDDPEPSTRALLAALHRVFDTEHAVIQIVLGPRKAARVVSTTHGHSTPGIFGATPATRSDSEGRNAQRTKESESGFDCVIRFGVNAATTQRRRSLMAGLLTAARTLDAPGVHLRLVPERARKLNAASSPWWWPMALNSPELLGLIAWPIGESDLPGVPSIHPRLLPPSDLLSTKPDLVVAEATAPGHTRAIGLDIQASLRHTWALGPNGTGKSTLLTNLIVQNIALGNGIVLIEPKGDVVLDVLARTPAHRWDDIVVLDPNDEAPLGLNTLAGSGTPESRVEGLVSVFRGLYGDSLGVRSQDILYSALLTLARRGDASLPMLQLLLTNTGFRRSIVQRVAAADPIALGPFWEWYDAMSDENRANVIAPLQNKLRPLLINPGLRAVIGQRKPRITMDEILAQKKILLVPLRKQIIGAEASRLTGSLVVAELWHAVQRRVALPQNQRPPVLAVIDEVQDYISAFGDLGDALAQARGMGAAFVLAHQYSGQLPPALKAGFLGNIRSRVLFQLAHDDATLLSRGHPEITPDDLTALPAFNIYASLATKDGQVTPYAAGRTLPLPPATTDPAMLIERSRRRYGRTLDEVEQDFAELAQNGSDPATATGQSGRRRRPA